MSLEPVRRYYRAFDRNEWTRLDRAEGAVEFAVNTHFLKRHLPQTGRVLDLGGGPGRYSVWLAEIGYRVVLADLSPNLLDIAREHLSSPLVEEIVEVDARDLSRWSDRSFDAAVVLGPLYHLPEPEDRARAVREVVRVVRRSGTVFFGLMPLMSLLRRTAAIADERHHLADPTFMRELLDRGAFTNDVPGRFDHGWGVRADDVIPWFEEMGLDTLALASSEGILVGIEDAFVATRSTPDVHRALVDVLFATATEPTLLGLAKHLLYVGRVR
jgi:ubiquinone/menaquinone biosynthesis C-methylase UbiE